MNTETIGRSWVAARYRHETVAHLALVCAQAHPWAPQYLDQCPALPLLLYGRAAQLPENMRLRDPFEGAAAKFAALLNATPKLTRILDDHRIPRPLRLLSGKALSMETIGGLDLLCRIPARELGQWLPEDAAVQMRLLSALHMLTERSWRAGPIIGSGLYAPHEMAVDMNSAHGEVARQAPAWVVRAIGQAVRDGSLPTDVGFQITHLFDLDFFTVERFRADWTLGRAMRAARGWLDERLGLAPDDLDGHANEDLDVCPLPRDANLGMGMRAVALVTRRQLAQEGRAMRHCVGGYALQVRAGRRIYSVQMGDRRIATAEVRALYRSPAQHAPLKGLTTEVPAVALGRWVIEQINGAGNSRADRGAELLLTEWLRMQAPPPALLSRGGHAAWMGTATNVARDPFASAVAQLDREEAILQQIEAQQLQEAILRARMRRQGPPLGADDLVFDVVLPPHPAQAGPLPVPFGGEVRFPPEDGRPPLPIRSVTLPTLRDPEGGD